jgi:glycopeptide antibiotics resistance protein
MKANKFISALFLLYLLTILLLVTLPLNSARELNNITIIQLRGDYFFHILLFLPWMGFVSAFGWPYFLWLLSGFCFAGASEFLQYFLSYRAYNVNDLIANISGVLLGSLLFWGYERLFQYKK